MTPYSLYIPSASTGAFHDVLSPTFANFLPGLPLYFSFDYAATRTTGTAAATLHVELRWYDATGTALTPWTNDTIINATVGDTLQKFTVIPPAAATSGKCYIKVTPAASPMQHDVWIKKLRLGKTEISATNGANWAANVSSRPANLAALAGTEGVNNSFVSIGSNGALTGGGGGQVTLPGIAPNVDSSASMADNLFRNANFVTNTDYWTLTGAAVVRAAGTNVAPPRVVLTCDGSNPKLFSEYRPIPPGARKLFLSYDLNHSDTNFGAAVYMTIVFIDAQGNPTSYAKNDFYGTNDTEIVHMQNGVPVSALANAWQTVIYTNIAVPIQAIQVQVQIMGVNGSGATPAPTIQMTNIRLSPTAPAADLTSLNSVVTSSDIGAGAADNLVKNALYQQLDAAGNVAFWKLDAGCTFLTSSTSGEPPKYIECATAGKYAYANSSNANAANGLYQANTGIAMWPGGPKKLYISARVRTQGLYLGVTIYFYRAGAFVTSLGLALQPTTTNTWQECTGVMDASAYDFDAYQVMVSNVVTGTTAQFADLRIAFTERSATLGAIWNGNIVGTPTNLGSLSGSEGINNGLVSIGANGALTGGGGGQVTLPGIAPNVDPNATANKPRGTWSAASIAYAVNDIVYYNGATWFCILAHTSTATVPSADPTHWTKYSSASLDDLPNGTTYGRLLGGELSSGAHRIGVIGSGYRVGDQRNLPAVTAMNLNYKFNGAITYSTTTTSATISVAAGTAYIGSTSLSYNAMSVGVTGTAGSQVDYFLFLDDPSYAGGTKTLQATTDPNVVYQSDGRVYVGSVHVIYPTSGTGGGTGSGGAGGCVVLDTVLPSHDRAELVEFGDVLELCDPVTLTSRKGIVTTSVPKLEECVRFTTKAGIELECSISAPIAIEGGENVLAPDLLGRHIPVRDYGIYGHDEVVSVEPIGRRWVMHITCENAFFLAGKFKDRYVLHHNLKPI